jgi:hypothetical protein
MAAVDRSIVVRDVEVRTWPLRADLLVIDPGEALALAYFPLKDPGIGKVADLHCGYAARCARALAQLEADQYYLRGHYGVGEDEDVCLRALTRPRASMNEILGEHGLDLNAVELPALAATLTMLRERESSELYELLRDWHDVAEMNTPRGHSARDVDSWLARARPHNNYHFHYLATGLSRASASADEDTEAYLLFRQLIDTDLAHFSLGLALRWLYFAATEFAAYQRFPLRALNEFSAT